MIKGFTLIELLAVIVILAIIALIATPIVLDIIEDSKESSKVRSAENYIHALELEIANKGLKNETLNDGVYSVDEMEVEIDGEEPTTGFVQIINGEIDKYSLIIDNQQIDSNEEYDVWDGSKKEIAPDSEGIYHVTKSSELAWISQEISSGTLSGEITIFLENNLDLNNIDWLALGTSDNKFSGIFDGNNCIIKNLYINNDLKLQGLFSDILGEVKNLIIKNSNIKGLRNTGILAGSTRETAKINNITVYNSKVSVDTSTPENTEIGMGVGGIVGQFQGEGNNLNVFSVEVKGVRDVGGIIGKTTSSDEKEKYLNNCYVDSSSNIIAIGQYSSSLGYDVAVAGGIVGIGKLVQITDCEANATIETDAAGVGGIAGQITSSSLMNSKSFGKIFGTKAVGGLVGTLNESTTLNCEVGVIITASEGNYVGALAGGSYSSTVNNNIISSYINDIKATLAQIIGTGSTNTTLTDNVLK